MRRTTVVPAVLALAAALCALSFGAPAGAQTGYPPGPCTATVSSQSVGSVAVGQTITFTLQPVCAWTPGTAVTVQVNGQSVGTKVAGANGGVSVTIRVVSSTQLEVDDPVQVPGVCGVNSVVGSGSSSVANGVVTNTATFTVVCPQAVPVAGAGGGTAAGTAPRAAGIAFTGDNIARMVAIALVLVVLGATIVTGTRNRRRRVSHAV